ncbi:MAG: hypothetical protein ABH952_00245 [Candidatus Omnitrophota bacterium]
MVDPEKIKNAFNIAKNTLLTSRSHPADILLGVGLNGREYQILNLEHNTQVNALDFLCRGTNNEKYLIREGIIREDQEGFPYFVSAKYKRRKTLPAEILAGFAQAGIETNILITSNWDTRHRLYRAVDGIKRHICFKQWQRERFDPTWVAVTLVYYSEINSNWRNIYKENVFIDDVFEYTTNLMPGFGSCCGTHLLLAQTLFYKASREKNKFIPFIELRLKETFKMIKLNQKRNGLFNLNWYKKRILPAKLRVEEDIFFNPKEKKEKEVYLSGHIIGWLRYYLDAEQIREEAWINKAIDAVCQAIIDHPDKMRKNTHAILYTGWALKEISAVFGIL